MDQELYTELLAGSRWMPLHYATAYAAAGDGRMLREHSLDGSTFLLEKTSWPPS